jgi:hypothetical protein
MAFFIQAMVHIHTNRRYYSLYKVQCVVIFKLSLNNKNTWFLNKKISVVVQWFWPPIKKEMLC